ncbi:sensor histidine kinase [Allosphingosinicella sp.]|jgi:PAS domain S-box-containing protein|uniref:sensor histidine kinase n=1 Tax=Allosphingosinicella sp. TaxID=2823234 RepID=UPI002F21C985
MSIHETPAAGLETLSPVLETALDAVVVMRSDGTVAAWNSVAERTFGWTAGEAMGRLMADLIIPRQHRDAHCAGLARYNETREERVLNRRIEITALRKDGAEIPVELSITTALSVRETVFVGFLRDISGRREAEERLSRQARETQLLFEITSMATETGSFEEALKACLEAICQLTGWPIGHALVAREGGVPELVSTEIWHEAQPGVAEKLKEATARMRFTPGVGAPGTILQTGEPVWVSDASAHPNFQRKGLGFGAAFGFPIKSEGRIIAALEFFSQDTAQPDSDLLLIVRTLGEQVGRVLERKRTEEHQRLLLNELNHRVKNTLAVIQSIASQTFRGDSATPEAREAFESRLTALATAHDLLTRQNWEAASLRHVIDEAGLGCGAGSERIRIQGEDVRVPARTAVSIAMALHELCTNAVKYGSLSTEQGTVTVDWEVLRSEGENRLRLCWTESGGPPVSPPKQRGFGSRMIERGLAAELGGTVELQFLAEGVRCLIDAPLPNVDDAAV